ncbi:hypothetical protein H8356DRAFT_1409999 [Neocallimastix lanati (nom. inval.)]|uniref:Uncharacterized protein n=1 Tax=Neocallimastix californiae TaxID=1754190 RepID=A0A1Y1ZQF3_9FUNG|nr:hypothetical protein H8356DRAFT_1409999 [Neocallimastix sp. JGI-2020a]ORY12481.1 hypothetical protein LY90DRAFT_518349 [Neocallimastix californiae]|eukprot:ORY12481.1 hypothetical protein LY90DRAFT_518349 [Neocallimastix californiae]
MRMLLITLEWIEFLTALENTESAKDIEDIFDIDLFLTEIANEYLVDSWDHYLIMGHNFSLYKPKNDKWNILKKLVEDVFNPATLFPHIDKLKKFVKPYVKLDKTPDKNGKLPGRMHEGVGDYTLEEWDANCEFTSVGSMQESRTYGLKYWILEKNRYVCTEYNMKCDPIYMNKKYKYSVNKKVESHVGNDTWFVSPNNDQPTETTDEKKTKTKKTKTTKIKKNKSD